MIGLLLQTTKVPQQSEYYRAKFLRFFVVALLGLCISAASGSPSEGQIQCTSESFREEEAAAKQKDASLHLMKLASFLFEMYENKENRDEFCGSSSSDYLALLWHTTSILTRIRGETGPFDADTDLSYAEFKMNYLWNSGFESGRNDFPANLDQISCLQGDVLQNLSKCEKLNIEFFTSIKLKSLPTGWNFLK